MCQSVLHTQFFQDLVQPQLWVKLTKCKDEMSETKTVMGRGILSHLSGFTKEKGMKYYYRMT